MDLVDKAMVKSEIKNRMDYFNCTTRELFYNIVDLHTPKSLLNMLAIKKIRTPVRFKKSFKACMSLSVDKYLCLQIKLKTFFKGVA